MIATGEDPTAALLWSACRPEPDFAACEAARSAGADLTLASDLAVAYRTSGLFWSAVESWATASPPWAESLRGDAKLCHARASILLPRIGTDLLEPLASAGLTPLVFKGAALAERYPDPGLRPMDDVDLIMPRSDHPAAIRVLCSAGWQVRPKSARGHESVLVHPGLPHLPVELHQDLAVSLARSSWLGAAELWDARVPIEIAGAPAFGLPTETEIVALATHAAKPFHVFARLIWTVDLGVVVQAAADSGHAVDWERVGDLATQVSARTQLAVALAQAARLGVDSPWRYRQPTASGTRLSALEPLLDHDWPVLSRHVTTRHRLGYALIDDRRLRVRQALNEATSDGPLMAPVRATELTWRAARRWWSFRRGQGQDTLRAAATSSSNATA